MARGGTAVAWVLVGILAACGGDRHRVRLATCADAAAGAVRNLRAVRHELTEADIDPQPELAALCAADEWAEPVRACFSDAATPAHARRCAARLTEPQRVRARAIQTDVIERVAVQLRERSATSATGVPECDAYVAAIDALVACPKLPAHVREAMMETKHTVSATWMQLATVDAASYAAAREAVATHCRQASETTLLSARTLGC